MKKLSLLILTLLQFGAVNSLKASVKRNFHDDITGNTISAPAVTVFCSGGNPGIITGSTPSGGSGAYTYQWQTSTDSINFTTVAGINRVSFDPPQISQTTWYRRLVTSVGDTTLSISNVIAITVSQPVANNTITAPAVTTFNMPSVPGVITGSTPSGDSIYTYRWQISTDNLNFTDISGSAGRDLTAPPLINQTTYFQRIVTTSGVCTTPVISDVVKIIVSLPTTGNTIQGPAVTEFCLNGDPTLITGGTPSGGNGRYSYQWQSSTDSINFSSINGAGSINFDPPPVSQTTWYRRLVFSGLPGAVAASVDPNNMDFFLVGGQSNASGAGQLSLQSPIPPGICWKYVNGVFTQVTTQSLNDGNSGSAWAAFVIAYYNKTGRKVCIVPAAVGASAQEAAIDDGHGNWDTTGTLVAKAVLLLNQGLSAAKTAGWVPVVRGILWDQGERDGNEITVGLTTVDVYQAALTNMISRFRTMLSNSSLPFYIFRTANSKIGGLQVQGAQEVVANMDINTAVVFRDAVDFTVDNGYLNPVGLVHYTQAGYNLEGQIGGGNVGDYTLPVVSNVVKINISNPAAPVLIDTLVQINDGNSATLAVAAPNNNVVYNWYDSPDATNLLFSGATYVTPPLSANKTYYAQAINGSCGISSLASVQVSIINGLGSLNLSGGTLTPVFATGKFAYTATVDNTITSITLTPTAGDSTATIAVNGNPVANGATSAAIPLIIGPNPINVTVTSPDSSSTKTYTLIVTRNLSANADLSALQLSGGTLSPGFGAATTGYTASVTYTVSPVNVTPTTSDLAATITVNGLPVVSGLASAGIPLAIGPNTITTTVTAPDGVTTKTYNIAITRGAPSTNANLSGLSLSNGIFSPVFSAARTAYTASVANAIASITITPTISDTAATITVNSVSVNSAAATAAIPLIVGPNTISVTVTAQDGSTTKTYTVIVTRMPSANANLLLLRLSTGSLSPAFAAATTSYTSSVSNAVSSTIVTPSTADANAAITVNGTPVKSGAASAPVPLNVGPNTISVTITAQDGVTIKTYTVTVTRAPSANASLSGLSLSSGTLTPVFATGRFSYTATVPYTASAITLTPTASDSTATMTINGTAVSSGIASGVVLLNVGLNTINLIITAQDGITKKTYTIGVTRVAPSTNANLLSLRLSTGTLSPAFTASTTGYTTLVVNSVTSATVTPTVSDATATITVNNIAAKSGAATTAIPLNVGPNTISVTITAQDGITIKTYTITVTRPPSVNAALAGLSLSSGTLAPVFATGRFSYTATVPYTASTITLTPTNSDSTATITVNGVTSVSGMASAGISLAVGANTITTTITAQDGITTKTYTIVITRVAVSAKAGLLALYLNAGTLSPVFTTATTGYTTTVLNSVTSVTVTPTTSDATATVTVNGAAVSSGSASVGIPLSVGTNTITAIVTAQNGITTKAYTVTVIRLPSNNADLSNLSLSSGTLSPVFAASTTSYLVSVANTIRAISVTPTTSDPTAAVTVNGAAVSSGTASGAIPLNVGPNLIIMMVTAQDGVSTKADTITVTRLPSGNANLSNLSTSGGALMPVFATTTTDYATSVANAVNIITVTPTASDSTATITVNGTAVSSGAASTAIPLNVGFNTITVVVTAQDGVTTKADTITVTRLPSNNAGLSNLSISTGTLSPVFATTTSSYTASVANTVSTVTITPTPSDATATVSVNGTAVSSGTASGAIFLNVGSNMITTIVTAQDGVTTKTDTITVTRLPSSNAGLTNLNISAGTLTPVFGASTTSYTATVPNAVSTVTVTPATSDSTATVTVNGAAVSSGTASGPIPINVGLNAITVIVTAQDGATTKADTITVTRLPSDNAGLSKLTLSSGTLSPVFALSTTSYTTAVSFNLTSVMLTPTTGDATARVTVNGMAVSSGTTSAAIPLNVGPNTITTIVTAQDGVTTKTYKVTITRAGSSNANLVSLAISAGTLSPVFATATTAYAASVANTVSTITVTPKSSNTGATIKVNGTAVSSGTASAAIPLNVGSNAINVIITAQDGVTLKTYTITVTRLPSANASLAGLNLSNGTLTPVFATGMVSYTAIVPYTVSSVTSTPTTSDATATVTVNGVAVSSGTASGPVPLNVGTNTITAIVTAQDGITTKTYTILVTRIAASTNADLLALYLSAGTLSPVFAASTTGYTATVANSVSTVTITPTTIDSTATVKVNGVAVSSGTALGPVQLNVGPNTFTTIVTAQDRVTTKTYTITVTRLPSSNAGLSSLNISAGTLTPVFATSTTSYTATVANTISTVTVTPATSDSTATVVVNGAAVISGAAAGSVPLNVGFNTITVIVTAPDGVTTQTYTVTVTRLPSSNASLSNLNVSAGTLTPVFAASTTSYTASVANAISTVTVTPTTGDATATVKVNGIAVNSGATSGAIPLNVGPNTITTIVTAQDGVTTQTYTVTITRAPSINVNLAGLSISAGILSPAFATLTSNYTVAVDNTVSTVTITPKSSNIGATITVNGIAVRSTTASGPITLNVGSNTIATVVTAQDGISTKTYTVTVTRAAASLNGVYEPVSVTNPTDRPQMMANDITVHQAVSPNGDGINDFFMIDGITAYPDNKLTIMNKAGEVIFEATGYDNSTRVFDGHSNKNGTKQPAGTYFYLLEYKAGDVPKRKTGFLILKW